MSAASMHSTKIFLFKGSDVSVMQSFQIGDDWAMALGAGGTRIWGLLHAECVNIQDFGFHAFSEDQVAKLLSKERQRFRNVALELLRGGEISCLSECLGIFPHSRPAKFKLIGETFGNVLCKAAQMLI